ncbi:hypothetical protein ACFU9B_17010 [Streptomyces sp. NPDC057592]|uniref:hypothetical protein n=1 Tax=unclassified Streptomyces TaxID=2593676 RepID=UPI0036B06047
MRTEALDDTAPAGLVADATAAPSMHSAQPWQFRYGRRSRTLTLGVDLDRAMPEADPATRALHIGCGPALLNLRVPGIVVGPPRGTASERALTARTFDLAVLQRALG